MTGTIGGPMTMTHADAIGMGAVEKYALGHLGEDERESFEEHFFDCPECARQVEGLTTFLGDVRDVLPSAAPSTATAPRPPRPWASIAAAAGFTLASAALAYQSTVVVPALRDQVAAARAIQVAPQRFLRAGRGQDEVIVLSRGQERISLRLGVEQAYPFYRCELLDGRGRVLDARVLPAPPGVPLESELQISVTVSDRPAGEYVLAVGGQQTTDGQARDVNRFRFVLRREEE